MCDWILPETNPVKGTGVQAASQGAGVRCWAFSPPGGLMSVPLAEAVRGFTTSIVVGKDIVCRTSVTNVGRMLDEMVSQPSGATPHARLHAAATGSACRRPLPCPCMHAAQGAMLAAHLLLTKVAWPTENRALSVLHLPRQPHTKHSLQ